MTESADINFMRHALSLARRSLGHVAPNPAVGCVIVKGGKVVGRGWTGTDGRPHAETIALKVAGEQARGACAYISLEPCCHTGQTPPCTDALIRAGLRRAVIACDDPDPRVSGQGVKALQRAGLTVTTGILENEARALNHGFILCVTKNRPYVTLKIATSADGKIAPAPGKQGWITNPLSRRRAHLERSLHDGILIGKNTAHVDHPQLTTRLPGYEHRITRVILDTGLNLTHETRLYENTAFNPLLVLHNQNRGDEQAFLDALAPARGQEKGQGNAENIELVRVDTRDIKAVLAVLAERGITRLLVEGGAQILTSFLKSGFYDRFLHFHSPETIGAQGVGALSGHDIRYIEQDFSLSRQKTCFLKEDRLDIYTKSA